MIEFFERFFSNKSAYKVEHWWERKKSWEGMMSIAIEDFTALYLIALDLKAKQLKRRGQTISSQENAP